MAATAVRGGLFGGQASRAYDQMCAMHGSARLLPAADGAAAAAALAITPTPQAPPQRMLGARLAARPAAPAAAVGGRGIRQHGSSSRFSAQARLAPDRQHPRQRQQQQHALRRQQQQRQRGAILCSAEPPSCPFKGTAAAGKPPLNKDEDRLSKYGWGSLRMCLLLALALAVAPQFSADPQAAVAVTEGYLHSWSWVGHAAIGGLGAVINAGVLGSAAANFGLLSAAASIFLADVCLGCGLPTLVYMFKTAGGDLLAGKLDQKEWWAAAAGLAILPLLLPTLQALLGAAGAAGAAVATPLAQLYSVAAADGGYGRILLLLFVIQLACELGDARLERWTFFRHRYSFEVATALLLAAVRLYPQELLAVQIDLVACMAYRLAGFAVLAATSPATTRIIFAALFRVYFWQRGTRMVRVRDPQVARAVLAASDSKGEGLESAIACPAWAPVLSLESIDGQLWRETRDDFDALMRQLPPAAKLQEAATARLDALVASGADIDADAIARWSLASFLSYLFGVKEWKPEYECLVQASWEWRKEIAVRGAADSAVKQAAVRLLTEQLLPGSPLWPIYGERWREPRYYSLLMQPFIISPAINLGDIAVALQLAPPGTAPDAAVRDMHPFPIFERYVDKAILHPATGEVAVPAGSHCIIFSADLAGSQFPIFGAGPRACPGGPLITGLLPLMQSKLVGCPRFHPQRGHESSGRHNDTNWSGAETAYFVKTVGKLLV